MLIIFSSYFFVKMEKSSESESKFKTFKRRLSRQSSIISSILFKGSKGDSYATQEDESTEKLRKKSKVGRLDSLSKLPDDTPEGGNGSSAEFNDRSNDYADAEMCERALRSIF